jgi:N-methylhydantoinase B
VVNTTGEGVIVPPYGLGEGRPGRPHDYRIFHGGREAKLGTKDIDVVIEPGDRIVANSAGGGGYGDPHGRDRALVSRDVAYGYVSAEAAKRIYGLEP